MAPAPGVLRVTVTLFCTSYWPTTRRPLSYGCCSEKFVVWISPAVTPCAFSASMTRRVFSLFSRTASDTEPPRVATPTVNCARSGVT